jgi:tripartite-type tricarboxylate transporter receptor subunit TctC
MSEAGYPALSTGAWTALLAPRGTPPAVIAKVNAAVNAALKTETFQSTLARLGGEPRGGTPKELADYLQSETAKWKPIVQSLHLKD